MQQAGGGLERPLAAKQARLSSPPLKNQQAQASEGGASKQWRVPCGRRRARLMQNLCALFWEYSLKCS